VPEVHQADAQRLQNPAYQLHVPTLFDIEFANTLWKKIQRGELSRLDADTIMSQHSLLPLVRCAESSLLVSAFDLANQTQRTVYDSLYLALAIQIGARMVTADQRLQNALTGTKWATHVCWIGDVP